MQDAPFHDYESFIHFLQGNMRRKMDNNIAIHGREGSGKSTVAANIMIDLNPDWDPAEDAIFTVEQYLENLTKETVETLAAAGIDPKSVTANTPEQLRLLTEEITAQRRKLVKRLPYPNPRLIDEAVNLIFNRNWNTVESKGLVQLTSQARILSGTNIWIIPQFGTFDPYFRERFNVSIYVPPAWDAHGMRHAPGRVMWRHEWFDFYAKSVVSSWEDVFDLEVRSMDKHPRWASYEARKKGIVKGTAKELLDRVREKAAEKRRKRDREPKNKEDGYAQRFTT